MSVIKTLLAATLMMVWVPCLGWADPVDCPTPKVILGAAQPIEIGVIKTYPPVSDPQTNRIALTVIGCIRYLAPSSALTNYTGQIKVGFFDTDGHILAVDGQQLLEADTTVPIAVPTDGLTQANWHNFGITAYANDPIELPRISPNALLEISIRDCAGNDEKSCINRYHSYIWDDSFVAPVPQPPSQPTSAQSTGGQRHHVRVQPCAEPGDHYQGVRLSGTHMTLNYHHIEKAVIIGLRGCIRFRSFPDTSSRFAIGAAAAFFYDADGKLLPYFPDPTKASGEPPFLFPASDTKVFGPNGQIEELDGVHLYAFEVGFTDKTIKDVLPSATVVVTAKGCTSNDSTSCTAPQSVFVQTVRPCVAVWPGVLVPGGLGCPSSVPAKLQSNP